MKRHTPVQPHNLTVGPRDWPNRLADEVGHSTRLVDEVGHSLLHSRRRGTSESRIARSAFASRADKERANPPSAALRSDAASSAACIRCAVRSASVTAGAYA